jgi:hypothetical protein
MAQERAKIQAMWSIQEWWGRSKGVFDEGLQAWFVPALVILVGFTSFGLGRLSASEDSRPLVSVRLAEGVEMRPMAVGGQVVASRSGKTYHFPWCPGATSMRETNKIWFKDEAGAQAAGYTPAGNCEGLLK